MLRFLTWLVLVVTFGVTTDAHADEAVALLPLDTEKKLEIYGQPVASELARVLVAGDIDVVVVGRKMAVPERARLIVDGTIMSGKGAAVVLTVRVRNTADGTVLATMDATAPTLANIDKAAADVAARVLPSVRQLMAELRPAADPIKPPDDIVPPVVGTAPKLRPMLVAISFKGADAERLRAPLTVAVDTWARRHLREPTLIEYEKLSKKLVTQTVKASAADLAIGLEILSFEIETDPIPLGRARVRVRISDAVGIVFNRVITTDTVVGDRMLTVERLAERTAREVVDIMRPHVKRTVAGWR
ncbi:MAG: hypothetical protein H0T42_31535 [Deltaproteobacteria bacterium]|nr:hypothetical protein [Deltaproteobacteria bacterium]